MVFKFIRSILEGRDDAKAAIALPDFLATMDFIERLPAHSQDVIAYSVELAMMKNLAEQSRKYLPKQCHQEKDYLQFVDSKGLKLLAEHHFSQARIHKGDADLTKKNAGLALELVGYYLLSRSWQDLDHTINIEAPGMGAAMIGVQIEARIHAFIKKYGRALPRSC